MNIDAMKKYFLIFALFLSFHFNYAQLSTVVGKTEYPFWINIPEGDSLKQNAPLLIFLHGKSLSGTNLEKVKRYGVIRAIENGKKIPAIVVAPQLPSGPWNPDLVLNVLEYVKSNYSIDSSRVYVCGMSLGSYGTLGFAGKYPEKVAGAVAICGGGNVNDACNLSTIPLWIQHGDKDFIVPLSESEKIVDAIKKCDANADLKFTIIPGGNHGNVENLFRQDELYDWLLKQVKPDSSVHKL